MRIGVEPQMNADGGMVNRSAFIRFHPRFNKSAPNPCPTLLRVLSVLGGKSGAFAFLGGALAVFVP